MRDWADNLPSHEIRGGVESGAAPAANREVVASCMIVHECLIFRLKDQAASRIWTMAKVPQLVAILEKRIQRGDYALGGLPTELELAADVGVSRMIAG